MVDDILNEFGDTVRRAVDREIGKPKVHHTYNCPKNYKIIWGSDYSPINHGDRENIYIIQGEKEFATLLRTIESMKNHSVGLETGFFRGGTHLLFREFFDEFISVETNPLPFLMYLQNSVLDDKSHFVIGYSFAPLVIKTVKELTGGNLDFVFIDGDHSYIGVKLDFLSYWPLLRDDGMIAILDANTPNDWGAICRFLDELKHIGFHITLIQIDYTGIAIIRKDEENKNVALPLIQEEYLISLDALPQNARICLYGSGVFGQHIKTTITSRRKDIKILYFVDTFEEGQKDGVRVLNVKELKSHMQDFDIVLITSMYSEEIVEVLKNNGIYNFKIALFYSYD
ncbi:MAG: class I SAM-dependent methyltransferase [Nitrospirae bacterium]|nr:class I SAM-dependent methyltransferase [Nitrospirota bacterium]